jgi:hypothetical protein
MKADALPEVKRAGTVAGDLTRALVAAFGWSCEIAARHGHAASVVSTLAAALGCTALTLGSVAMVVRQCRTPRTGFETLVFGALLASGPTSLLGGLIAAKTHHRALGGVTFAFVAAAFIVSGALVVRRVLVTLPRGSPSGGTLRLALTTLVVSSMGTVVFPFFREFGAAGSAFGRFVAEDLVIGVGFAAVVVALPDWKLGARTSRAGAVAWVLSVAGGVSVLMASMPLRAMLAERAPVALGPLGLGLGVGATGPFHGIPSPVDVSLH